MGLAFYSFLMVKPQRIGAVIRAAREAQGMSQQTLAFLADTSIDAIGDYENGKRDPKWPALARISAVLHLPLSSAIEYEVAAARDKAPKSPSEAKALREQQARMRKRYSER